MNGIISKKTISIIVVAIIVFTFVYLGVSSVKMTSGTIEDDQTATKTLEKMYDKINPSVATPVKASIEIGNNDLAKELPDDINTYPLTVTGNGKVDIEIFAPSEKTGTGTNGWINDVATNFNNENFRLTTGESVSVSIRAISSGTGSDYIISKKYLPTAYTPSNYLFGNLTIAQGGDLTLEAEKTVENVAGILLSNSIEKTIKETYGEVTVKTVVQATVDGVISMGYTNPLTSATGLNFLLSTLHSYDTDNILSSTAKDGFTSFQKNVPYVAYDTAQMKVSAASGRFNGMVMEYQAYINDAAMNKEYKFIPFGVRHDNPIYSVGILSKEKQEGLDLFVDYCLNDESQQLATSDGFNKMDYKSDIVTELNGSEILQAQKLWKENKDTGKDISAVFVADCSGSMYGEPMNALKSSLSNSMQYIGEKNRIGFVSYNTHVTIELPISEFNLTQASYFQGAINNLISTGGTASYDALLVATNMLVKEKQNNPNAKVMLFLLSDGVSNDGYKLDEISPLLKYYEIPVYTIAYGSAADTDELSELSNLNEAAGINANTDDVIYKLKNLFNAQM